MTTALAWPALAFCLSIVTFLALKSSRKYVVSRFRYSRGSSHPATPALEKESRSKPLALHTSDLMTAFPPSLRDPLKGLVPTLSVAQQKVLGDLSFAQDIFEHSLLRLDEDYNNADDSKYVYSGFSVREIKVLGDFPDYSALSGVPIPKPYLDFDIDKAKPRPYRPFRWPYHQTMSLTKLEPDFWIELEHTYKQRIAQRKELYARHGPEVLQWLPGSELACKELMEMAIQFICARYPQYFVLSETNTWLENKILDIRTNIREENPLLVLLNHIPEDFAITLRDPDTGHYVFRAGIICSSLGWNLAKKIGLKLHEVHQPVPDYKEKMQFSMDRFFSKMPTNKPIQRGSWDLAVDQPLYMPPGDPRVSHRDVQDKNLSRSRLHLRVDWQTLRRMPLSGSIVFNYKALFTPLEEFRDEPYIPSLVLKILRDGKENVMKYKNTWHVEHVLIPTLEEYEIEQKRSGLIKKDWEVQTLDESPWFPGWEKKWHRQQGF
ncbi:alpha-1,2-mannosyltransferase [Xylaria castorea]|nr:alpha-1,2-mannosyltransferase [Xylaria castorea]